MIEQKTSSGQTFASVWNALEDTPEEAAELRMRSTLIMTVAEVIKSWSISQREIANRLGMTQPRVNDLLCGRISNFGLDTLVDIAERAGLKVTMGVSSGC